MEIERFCEIFNVSLSQLYELSDYSKDDKSIFNIFYQIDRLSEENLLSLETNSHLFIENNLDKNKRYVILFFVKRINNKHKIVKSFFIEGIGIL